MKRIFLGRCLHNAILIPFAVPEGVLKQFLKPLKSKHCPVHPEQNTSFSDSIIVTIPFYVLIINEYMSATS